MFTAIAAVRIKPGMRDEFVRLIEPNARGAASEPGCIRFDLIQDRSDDHLVWFVEYYHSEEDFHIHQKTPFPRVAPAPCAHARKRGTQHRVAR